VALTEKQISALNAQVDEFRAADYTIREKIVRVLLNNFEKDCPRGITFDDVTVITLRAPSATLGYSQIFCSLFGSTFMAQSNEERRNPLPKPKVGLWKKGAHAIYSLNTAIKSAMHI
jgi:hypothetical protein